MRTNEFVALAQSGDVGYNMERKAMFHQGADEVMRRIIKLLGLKPGEYRLSHNQGGIAVSGEITLHTDTLYVQMAQGCTSPRGKDAAGILWRSCNGRKDFVGGRNHWSKWEVLKNLKKFASDLNVIHAQTTIGQ